MERKHQRNSILWFTSLSSNRLAQNLFELSDWNSSTFWFEFMSFLIEIHKPIATASCHYEGPHIQTLTPAVAARSQHRRLNMCKRQSKRKVLQRTKENIHFSEKAEYQLRLWPSGFFASSFSHHAPALLMSFWVKTPHLARSSQPMTFTLSTLTYQLKAWSHNT